MAQEEEKIVIDVEINVGDTEQKLGEVTKAISGLRNENKRLKDEIKSGTGDFAANNAMLKANEAEIKSLQVAEKELSAVLTIADKQRRTYSDSIRGQAAQLTELKNQYMSLSKAERDSAAGKDMLKKLMELDKQVKENDATMGNFQRNVGNYPKVFDLSGTSVGKFQEMLSGLGGTSTTVGGVVSTAFGTMKKQAIALGKAFLTPPIGLIVVVLSAIMFAVQKVVAAFKKNDEASTKLQQALSSLTPIAEGISWIFDKLALVLSKVALGIGKVISSVLSLIPAYKDAAAAANELVVAQDNLEEKDREYTVSSAKNNAEIARLRKESVNTQKYTNKEIEAMLQRADDLEMENLKNDKARKEEALRLLKAKAEQEKDTSDETADAIAAAEAAKYQAEESYYSGTMRLASRANAARERQASQAAAAANAAAAARQQELENQKAAAAASIEIARQLEDAILAGRKEGVEKQIEAERLSANRQIEDIQARLDSEKNLTVQARADLNMLIEQIKRNSDNKIDELRSANLTAIQEKEIAAEQKRLQILLEIAEEGSQNETDLRLSAIENLRKQELLEAEKTGADINLINKKYDKQREETELQSIARRYNAKKQVLDNEFAEMRLKLEEGFAMQTEFAKLELTRAQNESQRLISMDEETKRALFDTDAEYTAAVIASKQDIAAATAAVAEAEQRQMEMQIAGMQAFGTAMSDVLTEIAGDSKAALVFQKLIALANVSLNLAQAISAATTASTKGDPYTMAARIATNVASVIVAFSQVVKSIKATNVPNAPKFATGGIVGGTSYVGDNVIARVNSGEMILNAEQQRKLFNMIAKSNNTSGGMIDYEMLAVAMSRMPAPKLIYKEFTDFQEKIVTFDEHIKL